MLRTSGPLNILKWTESRFGSNILSIFGKKIELYQQRHGHFLKNSVNQCLDKSIVNRYRNLSIPENRVQATYLWIDGTGEHIRLKDRVVDAVPKCPSDLPDWQADGSSTYQATGENSDLTLRPQALYRDPFKPGTKNVIAMCDTYDSEGKPTPSNKRKAFQEMMEKVNDQEPWFGIEQEYTLLDVGGWPFGWPPNAYPAPQGPYYCGVGADRVYARDLVEAHINACMYAGIDFAGTNSEVMPAQWEYQIGPGLGIKAADDLWVSRYILHRIAEEFGVVVTFDPKPMKGNWNGAGAHTNFSTKAMRADGGMKAIEAAIELLSKQQERHIKEYDPKGGEDNKRRLVGRLETSSIEKFSWGIANRGVSVRVPRGVATAGKGYLEDRRPSSNCDPYAVCGAIVLTCCVEANQGGCDKKPEPPKSPCGGGGQPPGKPKSSCGGGDKKPEKPKSSCGGGDKKPEKPKSSCGGGDKKPEKPKSSCGGGDKKPEKPKSSCSGGDKKPENPTTSGGGTDKKPVKPKNGGDKSPKKPKGSKGSCKCT